MALTVIVSAPILIVGGVIMALRTDVPLSGLLLVVVPIMGVIIALLMRRAIPLFQVMQEKLDRINQLMRETLAGVRVIRAFVRTGHEEQRFDVANRDLFDTTLSVNRLFAVMFPIMSLIFNLSSIAVVWFGAIRVESGDLSIGNLTAFLQYLAQILFAVLTAVFMFILIPRAAVSAGRINEVLDTEPAIHDPERPVALPTAAAKSPARGSVEFRDVEFRYPGAEEPVLRGISFRAGPGETTAIVGSTGSGKSTLVNLIPRFYDVTGRPGAGRRRRRPRGDTRGRLEPDRAHPAEGVPVRGHGRLEPALRQAGRHRRRALARARDRPGTRLRGGDGGRPRGPDHPGRDERVRRPAPTLAIAACKGTPPSADASGAAAPQRSRPRWSGSRSVAATSSCSTTASRRSTSRPTRGCGPPSGESCATRR